MSKTKKPALDTLLNKLMRDKFGLLLDWTAPNLQNHVGPYVPSNFDRYSEKRQQAVAACKGMLARLADSEVSILIDDKIDDPDEIGKAWHWCQRGEINWLKGNQPPWFVGGFGHPDHVAEFEYWGQIPHFTNHEALFLSLGVEPGRFTEEEVMKISTSLERANGFWETLKYMIRRRDQIERQFPAHAYHNRINPKKLFDWFELVKLEVHPDFTSRYLVDRTVDGPSAENVNSSRPHKREIDSVCQLFSAMAIEYYGYEPDANRSPIPKEIGELAANLGIEISDDTIRKYLKRGASFISPDWKLN